MNENYFLLKSITCDGNEKDKLIRPLNTKPCHKKFYINKDLIFKNPYNKLYYQLCPYCNYIVNVSSDIIPDSNDEKYLYDKYYKCSQLYNGMQLKKRKD